MGIRPAIRYWWRRDHVEALLALDRVDDAVECSSVGGGATGSGATVLAQVTRCRGLVAAARGDVGEAAALLEDAVAQHEAVGDPFGRARRCSRSASSGGAQRQKRAAREAIAAALAGVRASSARDVDREARAELGRIGGRTREQGLTAAERRVAALVAEGRTNREVAAALFLGERTVETHLTRTCTRSSACVAGRARTNVPAGRAKFRGTHDFKLSAARLASVECRATSSRRFSPAAPLGSARRVSGGRARPPRR